MAMGQVARFLKKHNWVMTIVFLGLASFIMAGGASAWIEHHVRKIGEVEDYQGSTKSSLGQGRLGQQRAKGGSLKSIASRNLLALKREELSPVVEVPTEPELLIGTEYSEGDLKACTLPMALRGTLVSENAPEWSIAVLYNNSKRETNVYGLHENHNEILPDATLVDILSGEIIVRRREHFERCSAENKPKGNVARVNPAPPRKSAPSSSPPGSGGGVSKVSETEYNVERQELDRVLGNLSSVATKARIVPSFRNGKPNGFKFFSIKSGSIYAKIGLKNGDVVQRVNGYELNSPDKALELYQKLKNSTSVSVDLTRRGRPMTMQYTIGAR